MKIIDLNVQVGKLPLWGNDFDTSKLLEYMTEQGVMGSVVSSTISSIDFSKGNELVFNIIKANPRLLGMLAVNIDFLDESLDQMKKYLTNSNFIAIKIISNKKITLSDCDALLNAHRRYATPIFIEGNNADEAISIGEIAKEFNQMKFVLLGMGGNDYKTAVSVARRCINIYLEISGSLDPHKIKYAASAIGSHRMVYGSNIPYIEGTVFKSLIENSGIESREILDLYYNSAKRLFNWK